MGMKMAKASQADMDMAFELVNALEAISGRWHQVMPERIARTTDREETEEFSLHSAADCERVCTYLVDLVRSASLFRVVMGMAVLLDPANKLVDPVADTLEHHPANVAAQRRLQDFRNWMLLAFRAMNDADGVLGAMVPEDLHEDAALKELRERVKALARHVPALLGMGHAEAVHAADREVAPTAYDGSIETSEADARPVPKGVTA